LKSEGEQWTVLDDRHTCSAISTIIDNCSLEEVYSSTTEENKSMNKTVSDSSTYGIAMFSHLSQGQSSAPHYIEICFRCCQTGFTNQKLHDTLLLKHETPEKLQILYGNIRKLINYVVCH
jgi:hypothetical protein